MNVVKPLFSPTLKAKEISAQHLSCVTLREHQTEIVKEALQQLSEYKTTTIEIPPGQGKTIIGCYLAFNINKFPALIVFPSKISSLVDQWKKTLFKFGLKEEDIYVIKEPSKEKKLDKERKGSSLKEFFSSFKFVVCGDTRVSFFEGQKKLFKTILIDEAHMIATEKKLYSVFFNLSKPKYIITLTATLERQDELHKILYLVSGPHSIKRTPNIAFEVHIKDVVFNENDFGHQIAPIKLKFNKFTKKMDFTQYCKDLSDNEDYNKTIISIIKEKLKEGRKFIVLTKFVEHAAYLQKLLLKEKDILKRDSKEHEATNTQQEPSEDAGIKSAVLYGKLKSHYDEKVLIGTIPKLSTGYDAEGASVNYTGIPADSLILVHPIKQYQLFEQCKGRIMRTPSTLLGVDGESTFKKNTPIIFCLRIPGLKFSTKHIENLKDYIQSSNGKIVYPFC